MLSRQECMRIAKVSKPSSLSEDGKTFTCENQKHKKVINVEDKICLVDKRNRKPLFICKDCFKKVDLVIRPI